MHITKKGENLNQELGSTYVSLIIYAADKISHVILKNSKKEYKKAKKKIKEKVNIQCMELLYSCIKDVLKGYNPKKVM